jgi:hypothetical protein
LLLLSPYETVRSIQILARYAAARRHFDKRFDQQRLRLIGCGVFRDRVAQFSRLPAEKRLRTSGASAFRSDLDACATFSIVCCGSL